MRSAAAALDKLLWSPDDLPVLLPLLAQRAGLRPRAAPLPAAPAALADGDRAALQAWLDTAAPRLGLETEVVSESFPRAARMVTGAGPALALLPAAGGGFGILALAGAGERALGPDGRARRIDPVAVRERLAGAGDARAAEIDGLLDSARVAGRKRAAARRRLLDAQLATVRVGGLHIVRERAGQGFARALLAVGAGGHAAMLIVGHAVEYGLLLLAWYLVGRAVLVGRIDLGWLPAFGLVLACIVPLRVAVGRAAGRLALAFGSVLKRRLLVGALRLEPDEIRGEGSGALLGRVIESQAIESAGVSGAVQAVMGGIELTLAAAVLGAGAAGWPHAALLAAWTGLVAVVAARLLRHRAVWTDERTGLTAALIERMQGQRTVLAQLPARAWHADDDEAHGRYLARSVAVDRATRMLFAVALAWPLVGLIALGPAFAGAGASAGALAVSVGGIVLAARALDRLARGVAQLCDVAVAWRKAAPLFQAAAREELAGAPGIAVEAAAAPRVAPAAAPPSPVLEMHDAVFRYPRHPEPVLRGASLALREGDQALLEGPSGSGKSTLAALLAGLRAPDAGLVLARGLDRATLGAAGWRRRVAVAPQFHENHVLCAPLSFNLLLGRGWPPEPGDHREALEVCRALGLGPVVERMPAGIDQIVGEIGWQLSHGERSRLFIARALLQDADVVVLDESFASLDPETLEQALGYVRARARTLVVVAHP